MTSWQQLLYDVQLHIKNLRAANCPDPYFRGHADSNWTLLPSLSRLTANPLFTSHTEIRLFWEFRTRGSHLLPPQCSDWTTLFYMQHYGLPTRLLDWTTCFANAVYFALQDVGPSPCIWILNPYKLGSFTIGHARSSVNITGRIPYLELLKHGFPGAFATDTDSAIDRMHSQRGAFTVHADLNVPLEVVAPSTVKCFMIPRDAVQEARQFLELSGTNSYSIFPDLAGLAREIIRKELS